jgi:hypothetical protein
MNSHIYTYIHNQLPNPLSNINDHNMPGAFSGLHIDRYILFTIAGQIPINSLERPLLLVYITTGANACTNGYKKRLRCYKGLVQGGGRIYILFIVGEYMPIKSLERPLSLVYITIGANAYIIKSIVKGV